MKINITKNLIIAGVVGVTALAYWPIKTVPTGHRGVITVGGAIKQIETEGFTFVLPWQKLNNFSIRAEASNVDNAAGSTIDQQLVQTSMTVRYSIMTDRVSEVFEKYSKDGDLSSYVETATAESFKAVTSKYTAQDLIAKRNEVSNNVLLVLKNKLAIYGANIISVDVRNFAFSADYMAAINQKVNQEQLRLAAENKVLTVTAQEKEKVVIAQADADAVKIDADGKAYAVLKAAEAEAKSLQIQNDALSKNKDVLELRRIEVELAKAQRWDGALPKAMYSSGPLPLLNLDNK